MRRHSLRLRLLFAAVVSIAIALIVAAFAWVQLFERHVERRLGVELETHLQQLADGIQFDSQNRPALKLFPADPRFGQPYSGLYWQVEDENGAVMRSRSLWDAGMLQLRYGAQRYGPAVGVYHLMDLLDRAYAEAEAAK